MTGEDPHRQYSEGSLQPQLHEVSTQAPRASLIAPLTDPSIPPGFTWPAQPLGQTLPPDIATLLTMLPTKADIAASEARITAAVRGEIGELRQELQDVESRVSRQETAHTSLETRVLALENRQTTLIAFQEALMLAQDDLENRNRRNNIKLRGIPESTSSADLRSTVTGIFNTILDRPPDSALEIDRVHRVGTGGDNSDYPRDVLCRVHLYRTKDEIMRKARRRDAISFDGAEVIILSDLSRRTLLMRKVMKPLLDLIRSVDATYTWGYPLQLRAHKGEDSFLLSHPSQLTDLFEFLGTQAIEVPNWLQMDLSQVLPASQPRPQRTRRRRRRRNSPPPHPRSNEP